MEFKGTKGKWTISEDISTPMGGFVKDEQGRIICSLFNGAKLNKPNKYYEEIRANALLISKTPEMLEMLIEIRNQIEDGRTYITKEDIEKLIKEATEL